MAYADQTGKKQILDMDEHAEASASPPVVQKDKRLHGEGTKPYRSPPGKGRTTYYDRAAGLRCKAALRIHAAPSAKKVRLFSDFGLTFRKSGVH